MTGWELDRGERPGGGSPVGKRRGEDAGGRGRLDPYDYKKCNKPSVCACLIHLSLLSMPIQYNYHGPAVNNGCMQCTCIPMEAWMDIDAVV